MISGYLDFSKLKISEDFDLNKYQTGDYDVVTRDGRKARILCTNRKTEDCNYIVALVEQEGTDLIMSYKLNGHYNYFDINENDDLMLVKKKWQPKEGEVFFFICGCIPMVNRVRFESNSDLHKGMLSVGNYFKTREEAEEKLKEILELLKK